MANSLNFPGKSLVFAKNGFSLLGILVSFRQHTGLFHAPRLPLLPGPGRAPCVPSAPCVGAPTPTSRWGVETLGVETSETDHQSLSRALQLAGRVPSVRAPGSIPRNAPRPQFSAASCLRCPLSPLGPASGRKQACVAAARRRVAVGGSPHLDSSAPFLALALWVPAAPSVTPDGATCP